MDTKKERDIRTNEHAESHPSYGMVQISRIQCGGAGVSLFGSAVQHSNVFALRINRGYRKHDLGSDRYHASGEPDIVEVYLSPSQFVAMMTTMNQGSGVPCTLNRIGAEQIEDCPAQITEGDRIREEFNEKVEARLERVHEAMAGADEIINKKTLNNTDRETLRRIFINVERIFSDSAPFAAKQLDKAAERFNASSKAEIEDFINTAIQRAGIKALTAGEPTEDVTFIQLPETVTGESSE